MIVHGRRQSNHGDTEREHAGLHRAIDCDVDCDIQSKRGGSLERHQWNRLLFSSILNRAVAVTYVTLLPGQWSGRLIYWPVSLARECVVP